MPFRENAHSILKVVVSKPWVIRLISAIGIVYNHYLFYRQFVILLTLVVNISSVALLGIGVLVGTLASFTGLGGGFLVVPLLIFLGYSAAKSVGTSFLTIFIISISALVAHNKLANVDYRLGILLGIGGIIGAQIGSRLVEYVPQIVFNKIFALIPVALAARMFFAKA